MSIYLFWVKSPQFLTAQDQQMIKSEIFKKITSNLSRKLRLGKLIADPVDFLYFWLLDFLSLFGVVSVGSFQFWPLILLI